MKRLIAFLVLLALGITALRFAIGDDEAVRANSEQTSQPPRPRTTGVSTQQGRIGASVSQTGPIEFPQYRTIQLGDGTSRHEQVFRLKAADSQPVNDALQQLDDVEVLLFENDQPTARLVARQAFVELNRDGSGKASLREQKDIDLRDAVFTTLPGTKHAGMRLELGNAKIRVGDDEVLLNTTTETDPVLFVVDGARSGTMRGKGLQARLPRDRKSALQRVDVEVLHDPELETAGITVRAKGRMHYLEDLTTGAARVSLDDDVQVDLLRGRLRLPGARAPRAGGKDGGATDIRGDQFTGWLQRGKRFEDGREREDLAWRRLLLVGAPAVVTMGEDVLRTPKITVLPGPLGEPCQVTAHGGESTIDINEVQPGSRLDGPLRGTSPRRIHLLSPGNSLGALHRQLGFPQWTLRPLDELHVVVFEGNSRLDSGSRSVVATKGLQLFSRSSSQRGIANGFGDVRIEQRAKKPGEQDLLVTGNDGFSALLGDEVERWRLGPTLPAVADFGSPRWRAHHYDLKHGEAHAHGTGACEIERRDGRSRIRLRAPDATIAGHLADQGIDLDGLNMLDATIEANEVVALAAAGLPARALRTTDGDVVTAVAPRLQQIGPRSLRLLSAATDDPDRLWADLARDQARPVLSRRTAATSRSPAMLVQVEGPQIDAHHLGFDDVMVEAVVVDDWRPVVNASWDGANGAPPTTTTFEADRLRALPFAMTREVRRMYGAGATDPVAALPFFALGRPWLIADDVRRFHLDDPKHGVFDGRGKRLLLTQGAEAAVFVGDPDALVPAEVTRTHQDRTAVARGARVRVFRDEAVRLQALRTFPDRPTFLLPSVTLHDPRSTGLLAHMTASCQGNIDVLPDTVEFQGPVAAQSLRTDGTVDADGMRIDARELRMFRHKDTGEVVRVLGSVVDLDWSLAKAHSAMVELDLRWNRLIARDPDGATVSLPDQRTFNAPRIELNYETMAVTSWHGRLQQGVPAENLPR